MPPLFFVAQEAPRRRLVRHADHTNGVVIAAYLEHLERRLKTGDVSETHVIACRRDFASFAAFKPSDSEFPMGELRLSESCNADLEAWLLHGQRQSNATLRRKRSEVCTCFDWAARDGGLIDKSPYFRTRTLRLPCKPRREATKEELLAVLEKNCTCRDLIFFAAKTGARTCEAREALWTDVDWQERVIELFKNKTSRVTGESRLIGLEPEIFAALECLYAEATDKSGHVFLNTKGEPWTADALSRNIRRFRRRQEKDTGLCPSMFRHFWAGNAEENGLSDREIATGLGHTSTELVAWYSKARKRKGQQRRIAEKAAGIVGPVPEITLPARV